MARKTVFVRTSDPRPMKADEFARALAEPLRAAFANAAEQLALRGAIPGANLLADGDWSIWLEDSAGERRNFVLFVSAVEKDVAPMRAPIAPRRLGVFFQRGHAQGSSIDFIEASEYIAANFTGRVRNQLLEALSGALAGHVSPSGEIEATADGFVLRAPSAKTQVRAFDAELKVSWESD